MAWNSHRSRSRWITLFGRAAPRTLEIGFGNGEHLAALAAAHPERDYFGIEVHRPGVGHLLMLAATRALTNVRVSTHDAVEVLREQIAPASLDEVLVLFPDPWHKKRHHKRRLIQPPFVELRRFAAASGRRIATSYRLGGVRAADARGAERGDTVVRESLAHRRLDAAARRTRADAVREARRAPGSRSVGSGIPPHVMRRGPIRL